MRTSGRDVGRRGQVLVWAARVLIPRREDVA